MKGKHNMELLLLVGLPGSAVLYLAGNRVLRFVGACGLFGTCVLLL